MSAQKAATTLEERSVGVSDSSCLRISRSRRALDVFVAVAALVLLGPLLLLIVAAIRGTSHGPAVFRQIRVGENGIPFTLYKFRTMRVDARGPELTLQHDCRVTRIGALLRSSSMDELPQLANVLRGEMTLVGPRPETPALAARYPSACAQIFRYRPGITGPAQLRLRDSTTLLPGDDVASYYFTAVVPRRVALDLEFQAEPTLRRTLAVLVATLKHLFN
jgi:lipopolysaccharide/colanic/teichoic acid biosynthesis glycosyltransferase